MTENLKEETKEQGTAITRLEGRAENLETRLNKLEVIAGKNEDAIKELMTGQAEYTTLVKNLEKKIDSLDTKLFEYLNTMADQRAAEEEDWKGLIRDIIKWTIVALIGYILGGGSI